MGRFEGHNEGQGHHNLIFLIHLRKRVSDCMCEHKQILYQGYHTAVISVRMSKLKAASFFGELKSMFKVINEVNVI